MPLDRVRINPRDLFSEDERTRDRVVAELNNFLDELLDLARIVSTQSSEILDGGGGSGTAIVSHLGTGVKQHKLLAGLDLHIPKIHATSHSNSGSDTLGFIVHYDDLSSQCNGAATTFTLANPPDPQNSTKLYMAQPDSGGSVRTAAGVWLPTVHFTFTAADQVTLVSGVQVPKTNAKLIAAYWK